MRNDISSSRRFLINRVGTIRNKAGLSARELSLTIGKSPVYISKFENGDFSVPAEILLDIIEVCGSTPEEFFSEDIVGYSKDKECLAEFRRLSQKGKDTIINLMRDMKG